MIKKGMFAHSFKGDRVQYQFEILDLFESDCRPMARAQMYSWVSGDATTIESFPQQWIVENCELYETPLEWRTAGEALSKLAVRSSCL